MIPDLAMHTGGAALGPDVILPSLVTAEMRVVKTLRDPLLALRLRVQRPSIHVDIGFMLAILAFIIPGATLKARGDRLRTPLAVAGQKPCNMQRLLTHVWVY